MNINIKDYLYHGISDYNMQKSCQNNGLYTLESILKDHTLKRLDSIYESNIKIDKNKVVNVYTPDQGFISRVSLGYYPDDEYLYDLSKGEYKTYKSIELFLKAMNVNKNELDFLIQNEMFRKYDFAFGSYYNFITLLFDKSLLDEYTPSLGFMVDEICVAQDIKIDKYLKYIGVSNRLLNDDFIRKIYDLINTYGYDVDVIKFPSGESVKDIKNLTKSK